ncbi:MAG: hypothetical protein ACK4M7_09450 [Burkholderiales bacterium]
MKKHLFLLCFLVTACGFCSKRPWNPQRGFDQAQQAPDLDEQWNQHLLLLPDTANKKTNKKLLHMNICRLSLEDRQDLLETIHFIQTLQQKKLFLESLASFPDADQAHLMHIMVHLKKSDHNLIYKILHCSQCLSLLEKLRLLQITSNLPDKCQNLLSQFAAELQHQAD